MNLNKIFEKTYNKNNVEILPTNFINLNDILNGGFPKGRLIEIYGRTQIGKSLLALLLFNIDYVYFDLSRKLCLDYIKDNINMGPNINNNELFELLYELIEENIIIVIDDLTMLGNISNDNDRYKWLTNSFLKLQRKLINTESIVIVLNQIRINPSTKNSYNPHEGCLDAAVKIKMHYAEKDLVYLDLEKHYWGQEGKRCVLSITKNEIKTPEFYEKKEF